MRKFATVAIALALGMASSVALADDGNFFVNANAGASRYNVDNPFSGMEGNSFSKTGNAGALRAGYRWNSVVDYGVEAGYGFLGNTTARIGNDYGTERLQAQTRGWLLGGNLNYNINEHWYVDARAGWLRARTLVESRVMNAYYNASNRAAVSRTGEYFGVGGGYNFNKNLSLGLAYDTYRAPLSDSYNHRIGMYSLQAEYRF
ncbi:MAG TPA: outer membrane beta-barrel protein [Dyella sp.]|uniref:outer membrane beta-barrel protein n=1 Tax=Dyella sp. TaxID=1869338 RepID=UPI002BFD77B8|nr:outer membrane beta-barrel protein [Dyella sp.]HUB91836.1 outer membrane beta-barrel protein [Dyella sp.]